MADRADARTQTRWDAFLSYSSKDVASVTRIQRFLEHYRLPDGRRMRIYRDDTDISGGELPAQLRAALAASGCLLVCCSEAAARSDWVTREIDAFRELATGRPILPLLLDGDPPAILPPPLRDQEVRWSDLRAGWALGRPRGKTRVELVRAVAAAAGEDFRELLPLDRRRRRRRAITGAIAACAALGAAAFYPVLDWKDVTPPGQPVFGCGTLDDGIAFYQGNIPQAIKHIIDVSRDALGAKPSSRALDRSIVPRDRLLPGMLGVDHGRCGGGWVGMPRADLCVSVGQSDEEGEFADPMGGTTAPLVDVTVDGHRFVFDRLWPRIDYRLWNDYGRKVTPSSGLPISARGDELWLGFPADEFSRGDLWHSSSRGRDWARHPGISDVHSVHQLAIGTMIAARKSGELGFFLLGDTGFEPFEVPGKGDDIEICGEVDGQPVVRADRRVYQRIRVARWKTL